MPRELPQSLSLYRTVLWFVESRVEGIEIAAVKVILYIPKGFAETLEVDDLSLSEETDGVADLRIFHYTKNIVIGGAGFLFCSHILKKIRNGVAL